MVTRRDVLIGGLAACSAGQARAGIADGSAFGGTWRIVGPGADAPEVARAVTEVVARIDAAMSPWRRDSALSRFNRAETTGWQAMPPELCRVAAEALAVADLSEGAFDPSVGPAVRRFGFGPIEGGAGRVEARGDALRKAAPGATLDLCGIAKGHALDRVATALRGLGLGDALIEIGGEVRALGRHPAGRPWRVAVEGPEGGIVAVVVPGERALATSGHAIQGVAGPVAMSHVIDPRTGRPATGGPVSVSVLAPGGAAADAWSTALLARGAEGPALARRAGVSALFVHRDGAREATGSFGSTLLA